MPGRIIVQPIGNGWDKPRAVPVRIGTTPGGCRSKMFICIGWEGEDREPAAATGTGGCTDHFVFRALWLDSKPENMHIHPHNCVKTEERSDLRKSGVNLKRQ